MNSMRMNKYVHVLLVFAVVFTAMQLLTWSTAEAGKKYPKLRADAGDDFKTLEKRGERKKVSVWAREAQVSGGLGGLRTSRFGCRRS